MESGYSSINNRKILKNTVVLYGRMLLTMGISLYTSRVVLNVLGVDDYVVGWPQNGFYVDEVLQSPDFLNYPGRLHCQSYQAEPGKTLEINLPENTLEVISFPQKEELTSRITEGKLKWTCPDGEAQKLYVISTTPSPELHPEYGSRMVDVYFNRFEKKLDEQGRKGLNYFFQDELHYNLNIHSWCKDMPSEFKKRKGYDILPYLPALWESIGPITPKIRLDYAQVATELAEERYFKPIFDWHNSRGLIYGCDNNGRGLDPIQYLDYFRATSWYTAPGNDAPSRGSSFRQTKVSSSVTHLYNRPRTWLEAFHSMGWDSNGEWLTSQLDHHLIAGGNLLCLHGLYYSTHGGWWEWAPPCFHFRMPYWPHMKSWLKYAQRMCFVLSQGRHVCDIAILYPTESLQAYPGSSIENFWKVSDLLSQHGLDYDFLDYQSIQHAEAESGELRVAGEKYKILILADIRAMHHETLMKIYDFHKKGGIVIGTGAFPTATTLSGEGNEKIPQLRIHYFFRNIDTIYCCSNPDCTEVSPAYQYDGRRFGKLYLSPVKRCRCGGRVYSLAICRTCGEISLSGFLRDRTELVDSIPPGAEAIFEKLFLIPRGNADQPTMPENWTGADFDAITGVISFTGRPDAGNYLVYICRGEKEISYPENCPACESKTRKDSSFSPFFKHGTGIQKVNQLMADTLHAMLQAPDTPSEKLVLFSDSRQGAARLSAGIELDHYRDLLRQLVFQEACRQREKSKHYQAFFSNFAEHITSVFQTSPIYYSSG